MPHEGARESELLHVVPQAGRKQGIERRLAPRAPLSYAQTARFVNPGRIAKRGGTEVIGTDLPAPDVGGSWIHENYVCSDDKVFVYHEDADLWLEVPTGANSIGRDPPITPVGRFPALVNEAGYVGQAAVATIGRTIVVAWGDDPLMNGNVYVAGFATDGTLLWQQAPFAGNYPRLVLAGSGTLYLVWLSTDQRVRARTVSAAGALGSDTALSGAGTAAVYDAAPLEGVNDWVIAYSSGTNVTAARI